MICAFKTGDGSMIEPKTLDYQRFQQYLKFNLTRKSGLVD